MSVLPKTVIVGLGKTGYSCVEYLSKRGESIAVVDHQVSPNLLGLLLTEYPEVPFRPIDQAGDWLASADRMVVSPGVDVRPLYASIDHADKKEWIGDIALFCREVKAPIIAITGSNGKTTVATMMGQVIEAAGLSVEVCGNIGEPVLNTLLRPAPDYYVLELSSFQLEYVDSLAADVAVILNVEPDHLDRYASFEDYLAAKQRIYRDCRCAIVNADQPNVWQSVRLLGDIVSFSIAADIEATYGLVQKGQEQWIKGPDEACVNVSDMPLKGVHHWKNATVILAVADALGLPRQAVTSVLKTFTGLSHRCELVAVHEGVTWVNDSKATNVAATVAAIQSLAAVCDQRLVMIMGGEGKDADFSSLKSVFEEFVTHVILIGKDADAIASVIPVGCSQQRAETLSDAVNMASMFVSSGDVVALSPACASFDMFNSYEDRGKAFSRYVSEL